MCLLLVAVTAGSAISIQNTIHPKGVVIHHSAIPEIETVNANYIDQIHKLRGFGAFYWGRTYHIGYHYVILRDGSVQQGRPEHLKGAHTLGHNDYIGICLIGDFESSENADGAVGQLLPTSAQLQSLKGLVRTLQLRYEIRPTQIFRHRDLDPNTKCPGGRFPFDDFIQSLSTNAVR